MNMKDMFLGDRESIMETIGFTLSDKSYGMVVGEIHYRIWERKIRDVSYRSKLEDLLYYWWNPNKGTAEKYFETFFSLSPKEREELYYINDKVIRQMSKWSKNDKEENI